MKTTTVKRNGVFIIFPTSDHSPIKGEQTECTVQPIKYASRVKGNNNKRMNPGHTPIRAVSPHPYTGKKCWRCGEPVWRSDVNYCWDCYKYENFESR